MTSFFFFLFLATHLGRTVQLIWMYGGRNCVFCVRMCILWVWTMFRCHQTTRNWFNWGVNVTCKPQWQKHRWFTAQRCYVHFLRNWDLDTGLQPEHSPIAGQNVKFLIRNRNNEKWPYWSSSANTSGCTKALCTFHFSTKVLGPVVDLFLVLRYTVCCQ